MSESVILPAINSQPIQTVGHWPGARRLSYRATVHPCPPADRQTGIEPSPRQAAGNALAIAVHSCGEMIVGTMKDLIALHFVPINF